MKALAVAMVYYGVPAGLYLAGFSTLFSWVPQTVEETGQPGELFGLYRSLFASVSVGFTPDNPADVVLLLVVLFVVLAVSIAGAIVTQLLWFLYFWVLVAGAYLLGRGYCQARGLGAAAALDAESTDDGSGGGTRYQ